MDTDGNPGIRDFTIDYEPKRFQINGDVFDAIPILPLPALLELQQAMEAVGKPGDVNKKLAAVSNVFEMMLQPESAKRFTDRLYGRVKDKPAIAGSQIVDIMQWLAEIYAGRPTPPSEPSSTGPTSPAGGSSSTAGAPRKASTPRAKASPRGARSTSSTTTSPAPSRRRSAKS